MTPLSLAGIRRKALLGIGAAALIVSTVGCSAIGTAGLPLLAGQRTQEAIAGVSGVLADVAGRTTTGASTTDTVVEPPDRSTPASVSSSTSRRLALGVAMLPDTVLTGPTSPYLQFKADTGRYPATWAIWRDWGSVTTQDFPSALLTQLKGSTVPIIYWQPVNPANLESNDWTYAKIVAGDHDAYIRRFARAADTYGKTVIIRFAHEMDGTWFPWGIGRFTNKESNFKAAWKHIHKIFKEAGATNAKFAWTPIVCCDIKPVDIYPGDNFVDYIGFSGFNWGAPKWRTMKQVVDSKFAALKGFAKTKPILIAEIASSPDGGNEASWVTQGYDYLYKTYPRLKLVIYFNVDSKALAKQEDWRLMRRVATNGVVTNSMAAYTALLTQARFRGVITP